jgi:predicted naringenin-chalcone synthase
MKMSLSKAVPLKIRDELPTFIQELCSSQGIELGRVLKEGVFAVHPGGPKIIEAVQKKLELRDDQMEESRKVLFERGNMSSATLPHVWNEIIKSNKESGTIVVSLAFGPGLTIFGGLFEIVE